MKPSPTNLRVIAIDGPAGSGKSTVAKAVAPRLGLEYLDTGAMYRSVVFACLTAGVDLDDSDSVVETADSMKLVFDDQGRVEVNGLDATKAIRSGEISSQVSLVAKNSGVRASLVERQRAWTTQRGGGVLEGRDIGTVVFPDATLKVFLSANEAVRAQRRATESGTTDVAGVEAELARRDHLDSTRKTSPLTRADDALDIDTSYMTIDEVVDSIVASVGEREAELQRAKLEGSAAEGDQ